MRGRILLRVSIAAAAALAIGPAGAQCTVTAHGDPAAIQFAQSLAANSDSPIVRSAYQERRCNIRKLMHGGGRPCRSGLALDHVTIRVFTTATFHVFPARLADGHFCTTS
jgi:hypothetical protein